MNFYNYLNEETVINGEKENYYINRTTKHISRVQENGIWLITNFKSNLNLSNEEIKETIYNLMKHDLSKFSNEQYLPYLNFSWQIKHKLPINKKEFNLAWKDHYEKENHHPIGFSKDWKFNKSILIEICCDLQAMSQEFNEGNCRNYFETKWKKENEQYFNKNIWNDVVDYMNNVIVIFEKELD
jgi:hypothetical protein